MQKAACATLRSEISAKGLKCNKGAKAVRCKRLLVQKLFNVRVEFCGDKLVCIQCIWRKHFLVLWCKRLLAKQSYLEHFFT